MAEETARHAALFVTCLVDLMRPSVGFAALRLLELAGCEVVVPRAQTCCGQPAYNSGARRDTEALARQLITAFAAYQYVVVPSGSCAGMLVHHYPKLFDDDVKMRGAAEALAAKTFELTTFLVDVCGFSDTGQSHDGKVTYHDACAGLRELKIRDAPRKLLNSVKGLKLCEMDQTEVCCGFGGTFSVKYGDISNAMVTNKTTHIVDTGADLLLAGDLGCLMNIAGKLKRQKSPVEVRHIAELLAGMMAQPPIAQSPAAYEAKDSRQNSG